MLRSTVIRAKSLSLSAIRFINEAMLSLIKAVLAFSLISSSVCCSRAVYNYLSENNSRINCVYCNANITFFDITLMNKEKGWRSVASVKSFFSSVSSFSFMFSSPFPSFGNDFDVMKIWIFFDSLHQLRCECTFNKESFSELQNSFISDLLSKFSKFCEALIIVDCQCLLQ